MDVTVKKLPQSRIELHITLSWDEWKNEKDHAAEELARESNIAGFRPGKAPRDLIEKRFGKQALLTQAAEHAVHHSYPQALAKEHVEAIGQPEVHLGTFAEGEAMEYTVTTAVMPEVVISSWKSAIEKINKEYAKQEEGVRDDEVEKELSRIAEMRAKLVTVDREARLGDNVLVDFTVSQQGVIIENGKSEKHPLVLGKGAFIPGFEEQLVGMKEGEEKTFELTFPDAYHAKHLAGKPATFLVKLGVVQEREIPVVNDEFVKGLGRFDSLEMLKKNIQSGILEEKKMAKKEEWRTKILDALTEKTTIEYPSILVDEETKRMIHEFESQVRSLGFHFDDYLAHAKKTQDDLKKEWEPQAKKRLAAQFVLGKLADEEEIMVSNEDIEEEMNKTLRQYGNIKDVEKNIDMERLYTAVRGQLRNEKVFEFLEKI
ncbi:MAG: trigger factor [Candidatus Moranbacteria bacterium]|nr:trigger factor [Candidatus Moranbacteria bacterium]